MALPPISPSNTKRYFLTYNNGADDHTMQFRSTDSFIDQDAADLASVLLSAMAPLMFTTTVVDFTVATKNSNVRLPTTASGFLASYGTGTIAAVDRPYALTFSGRALDGRRVHLALIGQKLRGDSNYVYTAIENAAVSAVVAALNTGNGSFYISNTGVETNWYPRATAKQNDHVVASLRSA